MGLRGKRLAVPAAHGLTPADLARAGHDHDRVLGVEIDELVPVARRAAAARDLLVVSPLLFDLFSRPTSHVLPPKVRRNHRSGGQNADTSIWR